MGHPGRGLWRAGKGLAISSACGLARPLSPAASLTLGRFRAPRQGGVCATLVWLEVLAPVREEADLDLKPECFPGQAPPQLPRFGVLCKGERVQPISSPACRARVQI